MISLLGHVFGIGIPKADNVIALCLACVCIGGLYKLSHCKLRDCACCKWCFRNFGVDQFDDFNVIILVHQVAFKHTDSKLTTCVRVSSGSHQVVTQTSKKKLFQEPLLLTVEQGCSVVTVELLNKKRKALAKMDIDVVKDILQCKSDIREQSFKMRELSKDIRSPTVTLTIDLHSKPWEMAGGGAVPDEETGLLSKGLVWSIVQELPQDLQTSIYTHLHKVQEQVRLEEDDDDDDEELPEDLCRLQLLSRACRGPVGWVSASGVSTGTKKDRYMAVQCPPDFKGYRLGLWKTEDSFKKRDEPDKDIHLLRVRGVQSNRQKTNVVMLSHMETPTKKEDHMLYTIDRGDAVWVELLTMLIKYAHEYKEKRKGEKMSSASSEVSTASSKKR